MRVISKKRLQEFWAAYPRARVALEKWYRVVRRESWESFADVRETFGSADQYEQYTIFNIGGNKYRPVAAIHFNRGKLFVRHVLTHAEYDEEKWKGE